MRVKPVLQDKEFDAMEGVELIKSARDNIWT